MMRGMCHGRYCMVFDCVVGAGDTVNVHGVRDQVRFVVV